MLQSISTHLIHLTACILVIDVLPVSLYNESEIGLPGMSKLLSASPISLRRRDLHGPGLYLLLSIMILMAGGGGALLWDYLQGSTGGRAAADLSVVGTPSIAAATVDAIFTRLGSPMVGTGKVVEQASRQANIDDAFALAVWWTETNDGAAGVGRADRNPGSVRGSVGYPSAFDGYTIYPSYTAAIRCWFSMLRNNYVNRGLSSVYVIARPYVGTSSYPLWAGKVIKLIYRYRGIAPPPPVATVRPKPKPGVAPLVLIASAKRQQPLLGLAREAARPAAALKKAALPFAPGLPRAGEFVIIYLGLLAALAITLFSLRFKPQRAGMAFAVSLETRAGLLLAPAQAEGAASTTEELAISTDDLPGIPQLDFPALERRTEGLILARRAILLPADTGKVKLEAARPAGLLSRYRAAQESSGQAT